MSVILQFLADWHVGEVRAADRKRVVPVDNPQHHMIKVSLAFIEQDGMKKRLFDPILRVWRIQTFFSFI
jgi:hypothetical protein